MSSDALLLTELEALEKELKRKERYTEWCPHRPTTKQESFLSLTCLEALFGGAAGGGKSDAILMAALQYVDMPGYAALILRKTYKDLNLPGAIMSRAAEWLTGTRAKWSDKEKTWTFPSGSTLTFGYLETDSDKYRYQGAELQFIGVDEATQFGEASYRYLLSRLRRNKGSNIPIRARLASNPGGVGHQWVFRRFVESDDPQRVFVPSRLADNPHLDADEYKRSLALLDGTTRRQLEEGIWVQDASGLVYSQPTTIPFRPAAGEWTYLLGIDFGVSDATAWVTLGYRQSDRTVYVLESEKESGLTTVQAAERTLELSKRYPYVKIVGDIGGLGKVFVEEFRKRFGIPVEAAEKSGKRGFQGLLSGAIERKELLVVKPTNTGLLKEMAELPWKDSLHQKESDGFDNHLCDALLYAWRAATAYSQKLPAPPITDPLDEIRRQTAAVWEQYEADLARAKSEEQKDDYDIGRRWLDPDQGTDW